MVTKLKILYLLLSTSFVGWSVYRLVLIPAELRNPNPLAFYYCLALFVLIPTLGYVLLFRIVAPKLFRGSN